MRIEIVAGDLAAIREVGHVVAVGDDPVAWLRVELRLMRLQHRDDVGDRCDWPRGHARHVGPFHDLRRVHEMAVRVDEGGHQGCALQLDEFRRAGCEPHDIGFVACGNDTPAGYGDRRNFWLAVGHGENVSSTEDLFRALSFRHARSSHFFLQRQRRTKRGRNGGDDLPSIHLRHLPLQ